jgi:serine protease AprX
MTDAKAAPRADSAHRRASESDVCPVCQREVTQRLSAQALDSETVALVHVNTPGWRIADGLCLECAERFRSARERLRHHYPRFASTGQAILPIALRLGASEELLGRSVTVAFLDAGFFAHPDLVTPVDRILRYVDVRSGRARRTDLERPDESSWHGMMTSVVACGNGSLSGGLYRGLAPEARLVLVKVGTARRIVHDDIRRGLDWVIRNRKRYRIRIVNVSCGGDYEASYLEDALCRSADRASREGILVIAAAGNAGHVPGHPVLPPASAPSVLTVGGVDDKNRLAFAGYGMYHSSFGPTIDGLQKPEVIAPGIWVAAPILPGTPTADQAELLSRVAATPDSDVKRVLRQYRGLDPDLDAAGSLDESAIRLLVEAKLRDGNVISGAYKHVDGTSFAAPIVASLAAQMLEGNPRLLPGQVKRLIIDTARRIPGVSTDRQGWGAVDAGAAVRAALETAGREGPKDR